MNKHNCKDCSLKSAAASTLNPEESEVLEKNSVEVSFTKGEIIIKQNAFSLNIAYLRCGIAKLHIHGPSKEKILKIVKAPAYLGIPTTFGDKINQFSATSLTDTKVCFIDSNIFKNFIHSNGKFAYEIIVELSKSEISDYQRFASQTQKQIPGLVAETIICLADKIYGSDCFQFPLTRGEMGDLIGTSRESVSRILTEFSNEGIIAFNGNEITIIKKETLLKISEKG